MSCSRRSFFSVAGFFGLTASPIGRAVKFSLRHQDAMKALSRVRTLPHTGETLIQRQLDLAIVESALERKLVTYEQLGITPRQLRTMLHNHAGLEAGHATGNYHSPRSRRNFLQKKSDSRGF